MTTYFQAPAANGQGVKLKRFENEIYLDMKEFNEEKLLTYISNFPYEKEDILLVSYPKCGNHWIGNMVWKLKTLSDYKRPKMTVLEFMENDSYEMQEVPRIIQTHIRPSRLPKEHMDNKGKVVLMLRNPKDACVSFYHHLKESILVRNGQSFDEFYESYFSGEMLYTSYIDILKEWEELLYKNASGKDNLNIEVFYYEDCKINPMDNLVRLNNFLGFDRDHTYLRKVLEQTSFKSMRQHELQDKSRLNEFCVNDEGNSLVYRQGDIGDWKHYFTVAQSERVDALIKEKLTRGIIKFHHLT